MDSYWFLLLINVVLYKTLALESSVQMWIFFKPRGRCGIKLWSEYFFPGGNIAVYLLLILSRVIILFSGINNAAGRDCQTTETFHAGRQKGRNCAFISLPEFLPRSPHHSQPAQNVPHCALNYYKLSVIMFLFKYLEHLQTHR